MGQKSRRYAVGAEGLSAYHVSLIVRKNALTSGGTRDRGQGVSLDSVKTARKGSSLKSELLAYPYRWALYLIDLSVKV